MIKAILNYFKPKVEYVYTPTPERYTPLGSIAGYNLYFIEHSSGKIYRLTQSHVDGYEQLTHIVTLMRF